MYYFKRHPHESLTGFSSYDSAGSVQLAALGALLSQNEFELWDLGMGMDYKYRMGAHNVSRINYLKIVNVGRELSDIRLTCEEKINCKDIFTRKDKNDFCRNKEGETPPT